MESLTESSALMVVTSSPSEPETTTVELCTNGDATLVVGHKRFVVSSEILKISSDYFKALFGPNFQEGKVIQNGGNPEIVLHDDDPEVMELILSILHYHFEDSYRRLGPQMILKVAEHSDKYQCKKPLTPWITQWVQKVPKDGSVKDFDYLLTAAYVFGAEEHLNTISVAAIRNLPPNFNITTKDELFLPQALQNELVKKIRDIVEEIRYSVELVFDQLGPMECAHPMLDQREVCIECHRVMPVGAKKCHPCRNTTFKPQECTNHSRKTEYFEILRSLGLWPTRTAFNEWSVADIAERLQNVDSKYMGKCGAGQYCPLQMELNLLDKVVQRVANENIEGLRV